MVYASISIIYGNLVIFGYTSQGMDIITPQLIPPYDMYGKEDEIVSPNYCTLTLAVIGHLRSSINYGQWLPIHVNTIK